MAPASDIDGKYNITTQSVRPGSTRQSDGFTIIKGGKTLRIDGNGCEWSSTFEWVADNRIRMTSIVDPVYAVDNFTLTDAHGRPTTQPQTYEAVLNVTRLDGGLLRLTGTIPFGDEKITLVMRKAPPDTAQF